MVNSFSLPRKGHELGRHLHRQTFLQIQNLTVRRMAHVLLLPQLLQEVFYLFQEVLQEELLLEVSHQLLYIFQDYAGNPPLPVKILSLHPVRLHL